MLTKFDVRSSRVKAVCFHKQRPWVICGLHNGVVQIWDYRMNTAVETYHEHEGAVRGVDFHTSQPLFVTGGDDFTVKVWNHKLRRCLFTLHGHLDYVRTTFFHPQQPWIISASDDFHIRIWNWQNRKSIACLPGHTHYVMCAKFHPSREIAVSCSVDKTIRVWDISALSQRREEPGIAQDLIGTTDCVLLNQLESHEKGINWVSFNPSGTLLVSAADDRTVRLWDVSGAGCFEVMQMRGFTQNVCAADFLSNGLIVAAGEDRSFRVFLPTGQYALIVIRREIERYWTLAVDLQKNLIAAGHDTGLQVFKLFRERPPSTIVGNSMYYVSHNKLRVYNFETRETSSCPLSDHLYPPLTISCNPGGDQVVMFFKDRGVAEVVRVPRGDTSNPEHPQQQSNGTGAVFFGPNKYAFVCAEGKLNVCDVRASKSKVMETAFTCTNVFPGPVGCILCQSNDSLYLYHAAQHGAVAEATVSGVKYAVWDKDFNKVALISKNTITVMTKRLKAVTTVSESTVRIKSAVFDESRDVMYFTTSNHLKYCNLRTGETSTISTLKNVAYLVRAVMDTIWVVNRSGKVIMKELDNLELTFKLKLQQRAYRDLIRIIQRKELKGQALVGYLRRQGHSEIALHFVTDALARFNLAVECGALDIAKATAVELNQSAIWRRLAETATRFGDIQLAQFANSKAGNYYASGLLSLITGNSAAIGHLIDSTNDDNFKLHYGMYVNDIEQRVQILCNANQLPLAYVTAKSHGLHEIAAEILSRADPETAQRMQTQRFQAPIPSEEVEAATGNWPMLHVEESVFARMLKEPGQFDTIADVDLEDAEGGTAWDDEDDDLLGGGGENADDVAGGGDSEEGGGWDDDLDIDVSAALGAGAGPAGAPGQPFVVPREYPAISQTWCDSYSIPAFHVAAGSFGTALDLLKRQIALADPAPLKPYMLQLWASVNAARPGAMVPTSVFALSAHPPSDEMSTRHAPSLPDYMPVLAEKLRTGYQLFVDGKFAEALAAFESIIHLSVLTVVKDDQQRATLREILSVAPEYARALALQLHLRNVDQNSAEALELALYFTHFKLHPVHMKLALTQAMSKSYKKKNLKTAANLARRLLDLDPPKNKAQQAAAIIAEADRNPTDEVQVQYDELNPFTICSVSHRPMYKGVVDPIRCSYCLSTADPSHKGSICPVCKIAQYGADCAGISNRV